MMWLAKLAWWFANSKVGRIVAAIGTGAIVIGVAMLKVFSAGKAAERQRQDQQSLENFRERARIDDEVRSLPPGDVERRLSRWVRPDDGR